MSSYPTRQAAGEQITAQNFNDFTLNPTYTYGETISAGHALYLKASDGKAYKADADVIESVFNFIGFAAEAGVVNDTKYIVPPGKVINGLSSLTTGSVYYLSNTAGGVSTSEGTYSLVVGIAISTTAILIAESARKAIDLATTANMGVGTSGEAITLGDAIYVKASDSKLYKTDADADESTYSFVGIAQNTVAGADATLYYAKPGGIARGLSSLTAGSYYFLSGTAGALSATPHATRLAKVGQALSTTTFRVCEPKFIRTGVQSFAATGTQVQTCGFYPSKITLIASCAKGARNVVGSISNKASGINTDASLAGSTGFVGAESWKCIDAGTTTTVFSGGVSAYSQTGFTLNCGTYDGTYSNTDVYWEVESL